MPCMATIRVPWHDDADFLVPGALQAGRTSISDSRPALRRPPAALSPDVAKVQGLDNTPPKPASLEQSIVDGLGMAIAAS